jgi:hypothetical protein
MNALPLIGLAVLALAGLYASTFHWPEDRA